MLFYFHIVYSQNKGTYNGRREEVQMRNKKKRNVFFRKQKRTNDQMMFKGICLPFYYI
jgi:hypothetical protein